MLSKKIRMFSAASILLIFSTATRDVCAKPPSGIVGGNDATIEEFPSMVSLRLRGKDHNCGGSLITNKHILTAAHCLVLNNKRHYVYKYPANNITVCTGGKINGHFEEPRDVAAVYIHEMFTGNLSEGSYLPHDIGIVTLKEAIELGPTRRPIGLPSENTKLGEEGYIAGWGDTVQDAMEGSEVLQKAVGKISECPIRHGATEKAPDTEICMFSRNGVGTCSYDSGGPLIVKNKLVGIASWLHGYFCGNGNPDVYTRVFSYLDWIQEIIDSENNN